MTERLGHLSLNPCYVVCYGIILDKSLPVYTTLGFSSHLTKGSWAENMQHLVAITDAQ